MSLRSLDRGRSRYRRALIPTAVLGAVGVMTDPAAAQQRTLGVDTSYWQGEITQDAWNTAFSTGDRQFAFIRSSRGGTTGLDQPQGTPGGGTTSTLSRRYDDPRFVQSMVRANNAGLMTSAYHFARPDIAGNTGTDEANHFMQMAGAWMRPGYLLPMYDLEAGQAQTTPEQLAQFSLDFSNRLYQVMQIRPSIYASGNYFNDLSGASQGLRDQIAQPAANAPSVVSPAFGALVGARYPAGSGNPYNGDIQNENPSDVPTFLSTYYGPFDDYGTQHPWNFWQYSSGEAIPGFADTTTDGDVSHGDIEYVRNYLVPAVWFNDNSGDWSTLDNWNSGQAVTAPQYGAGQATPFAPSGPLPTPRLPGAAGSGPTSGQYDTVILERPDANITVTVSTGAHNVRKLYMRETLNITGGSLTVNYNPEYRPDTSANVLHAGPISAQFSGDVTLSGSGAFSAHTVLVDAARNFNLNGGTLTLDTIALTRGVTAAKINIGGNVTFAPLNNAAAVIGDTGSGNAATMDLNGGTRTLTVNNGGAAVDLSINVPIVNGGLIKAGPGTLQLNAVNTYAGGTTVNAGTLTAIGASALGATTGPLAVNNPNIGPATNVVLNLSTTAATTTGSLSGTIAPLAGPPNTATINNGGQLFTVNQTTSATFAGVISGTGGFRLGSGSSATLTLTGANNYTGGTSVLAGTLKGNTTSLQGAVLNNAAVIFDQTTSGTYGGNMSGTGSLTKTGGGTLTLAGTNSYVGGTTVSAGTLKGSTTSLKGIITNNASVNFDQPTAGTYTGNMSGTGSLIKTGAGVLTLSGSNSYSGGTTVSAGTLKGTAANLQGDITNDAAVTFDQPSLGTYAGNMSGTGALAKTGAGTLILSGTNSYAGGTTVTTGTLQGTTASLQGDIANNGSVAFDQSAAGTYAGTMSGAGSLVKSGGGTVTFSSASNSYTGGTHVQAGVLQVARLHQNNPVNITGGTLRVLDSAPTLPAHPAGNDAFVSRPSSLAIAAGATLDLTNNDLVLDYSGASPVAAYEALVASAYNVGVGDWSGSGITSSVAQADGNYVVAIADNAALAAPFGTANGGPLFAGVDVDIDTILIKFTHRADVDLDGMITPNDSAIFGGNYSENDPAVWATGDMDYDGVFTPNDAAIFGGYSDESLVSLPEPGTLGAWGLTGLLLARRSRTRRPPASAQA